MAAEAETKAAGKKVDVPKCPPPPPPSYGTLLRQTFEWISATGPTTDTRPTHRALRTLGRLRRKVDTKILQTVAENILGAEAKEVVDDLQMVTSMHADSQEEKVETDENAKPSNELPPPSRELALWVHVLVTTRALDAYRNLAAAKSMQLDDMRKRLLSFGVRLVNFLKLSEVHISVDALAAAAWQFAMSCIELAGELGQCRSVLMDAYRGAVLRRHAITQAATLNLNLRIFVLFNEFEAAMKFASKAIFPESLRAGAQHARYAYYLGRIEAAHLDYSSAHQRLLTAYRRAPQKGRVGLGFRMVTLKFAIVVELLMGGIPDRSNFSPKTVGNRLKAYERLVVAVRGGDVGKFNAVVDAYRGTFERDGTLVLIERLYQSVLRAGLRMISLSYSRISLADAAKKLGLESPEEADGVASKASLDGILSATIDYNQQSIISKGSSVVYTTSEPAQAFHKRIAFCLEMYDEAVRALKYPAEEKQTDVKDAEARRLEHLELLAKAEESDADDLDML